MLFDDESVQLVEDRLASRVSIVFSHEFLEEFPSAAQIYFNEGSKPKEKTLKFRTFRSFRSRTERR